ILPYTYVYYNAIDRQTNGQPCVTVGVNGCNGYATLNEIDLSSGPPRCRSCSNQVDLSNPGRATSANRVSADLSPPRTQELMVGADYQIAPNFGISATVTYRYMNDFLWSPGIGLTPQSYVQTGIFSGTYPEVGTVNIPLYGVRSVSGPGREARNRPDYHQRYVGFEISATKRLANRWMGRFAFASASWNEYFDSPAAILDRPPTPAASGQYEDYRAAGPLVNGGPVVVQTSSSGTNPIYLLPPKYQLIANGLYQGPWGFDFGANLVI